MGYSISCMLVILTILKLQKNGDILVVSITGNKFVNKGPGRPAFNVKERLGCVSALEIVDYVYVSDNETAIDVIKNLSPIFIVKV